MEENKLNDVEERTYSFTENHGEAGLKEVTLKESELQDKHIGHLLRELNNFFNKMPVIVQELYLGEIKKILTPKVKTND